MDSLTKTAGVDTRARAKRVCAPSDQTVRPAHFNNLWRIAGAADEHAYAGRLCEVVCHERDEDEQDVVRVRLLERELFDPEETLVTSHMLFPHRA